MCVNMFYALSPSCAQFPRNASVTPPFRVKRNIYAIHSILVCALLINVCHCFSSCPESWRVGRRWPSWTSRRRTTSTSRRWSPANTAPGHFFKNVFDVLQKVSIRHPEIWDKKVVDLGGRYHRLRGGVWVPTTTFCFCFYSIQKPQNLLYVFYPI